MEDENLDFGSSVISGDDDIIYDSAIYVPNYICSLYIQNQLHL